MTEQTMQSAQDGDEEEVKLPGLPANTKNYMTPACYRRLLDEREHLVNVERPQVVSVVSWAASNGDRSENGDYQYGKRRLREIDRELRKTSAKVYAAAFPQPCPARSCFAVAALPKSAKLEIEAIAVK